jgi:hypothetical protein
MAIIPTGHHTYIEPGDREGEARVHTTAQLPSLAGGETEADLDGPPHKLRAPAPYPPIAPWVIVLMGLATGVTLLVTDTLDRRLSTDVFWQLAAGKWMLAHHSLIGSDPFSYTESHRRWINDEWGAEVVLAALYKAMGAAAYNVVAIVTGTLSLICSLRYARSLGARGGRLAAVAILLAAGISSFVTQDRGLSFSLIWLPLELLVLHRARSNPRWLWWLPVLSVAWVNTHGSILVGLAVLGIELAWSLAPQTLMTRLGGVGRSPFPKYVACAAIGSLLAACVTPYGPGLLLYDLKVSGNSQIAANIVEWQSPDFHSAIVFAFFAVPLVVFMVAIRNRRVVVLETTLTVLFFIGALRSERFVIYLMVATVGLAATIPVRPLWSPRARRWTGAVVVGVILGSLAMGTVPAGTVSADTPVAAFNFLSTHPGRIFTQYTWGDYSIARHRQTFADGRTDLFVGPILTEFFDVGNVSVDPDPILSRYHVDYVVWAPRTSLYQFLIHDSRWKVVDRTGPAVVFARRSVWNR